MLIVVIIAHLYVFEDCDCIVGEGSQAEVFGQEIGGDAVFVESHESGGEGGCYLAGDAGLMESYHALLFLAGAYQNDVGGAYAAIGEVLSLDFHLIAGDKGYAAPKDYFGSEEVGCLGGYATPGALAFKSGDGTGVCYEEARVLPYQREEFVEVVGGGSSVACGDAVTGVYTGEKSKALVVDKFPFLTFFNALDTKS
jgi:hypothetical protein